MFQSQISSKWRGVLCLFLVCFMLVSLSVTAFAEDETDSVIIPVKQTFSSNIEDSTLSTTFRYCLSPVSENAPMPTGTGSDGIFTFTITGNGTFNVGPISFSRAGEYHYTIKQIVSDKTDGYLYDEEVFTLTVLVKNTDNGLRAVLELPVNSGGNKETEVHFTNKYERDYIPVEADPPVEKIVEGRPSTTATFSFLFQAASEDNPMPDGSSGSTKEVSVKGAGSVEVGTIRFTKPGEYVYTISEKNTGLSGYTYDTTTYVITYTVVSENGVLKVARTILANGQEYMKATFTNKYSSPATPGKPGTPKTGDSTNIRLWVGMMSLSFLLLVGLLVFGRQRYKNPILVEAGNRSKRNQSEKNHGGEGNGKEDV